MEIEGLRWNVLINQKLKKGGIVHVWHFSWYIYITKNEFSYIGIYSYKHMNIFIYTYT